MITAINRENMGAFIDAVYAIAVTILALEIPGEIDSADIGRLFETLLTYVVSFIVLFALWIQHRRINHYIESYTNAPIWLNAFALLLVCLIPRATTFVFEYGGNVTGLNVLDSVLGQGWSIAEAVDLLYLIVILLADLGLLGLFGFAAIDDREERMVIRRSKFTLTAILTVILVLSFVLEIDNRWFLIALPILLIFERWLSHLIPHEAFDD